MTQTFMTGASCTLTSTIMMALGRFRFGLSTAAYQRLQRRTDYPWQTQNRLGRKPARQKTHDGDDQITLSGVIHPHFRGGLGQLDAMRTEAARDEPLQLVDGKGVVYGLWVILSLHEGASEFFADGAPRAQNFRLQLGAYGEDAA